jgi:hypothetical protein
VTTSCDETSTKAYEGAPAPSTPAYNHSDAPKPDDAPKGDKAPKASYGPAHPPKGKEDLKDAYGAPLPPKAKTEGKPVYGDISGEPVPAPAFPVTPEEGYEDGPILSSANTIAVGHLAVALLAWMI